MHPPDVINLVITKSITHQLPDVNAAAVIAEMFGLSRSFSQTLYDGLQIAISPGQIIAIVGPSGAGKSVLLKEIAAQFPGAVQLPHRQVARSKRPAIAILRDGSLEQKLKTLSICGLADALALVTPARLLSGGQQYRLALAAALHSSTAIMHCGTGALHRSMGILPMSSTGVPPVIRVADVPSARRAGVSPARPKYQAAAQRPALLLADEFAACLDLPTAYLLCRQMRRLITPATPIAVVLATPRLELLAALQPDKIIVKPLQAQATIIVPRKKRP